MDHEHDDPRQRPAQPEHPMVLEGGMAEGSTRLMLRMLAEDLLRSGIGPEDLRSMCRDPNYQALAAARAALGEAECEREIFDAAARVGTGRFKHWESAASFAPATLTVSARPNAAAEGD